MPVPLRCRCGKAQGRVEPASKFNMHVVCYCNDCRAFIHSIGRAEILDEFGGSELFVSTPSQLKLTAGFENLRCLRLSERGMLRWYWSCCNTPLANTLTTTGVPFVSIHRAFIDLSDTNVLGPTRRVQARFAVGPRPPKSESSQSPATIVKIMTFLLIARLRGAHKPNPLFADGMPAVTPRVLSESERNALRADSAPG
jgi:hypothetical protein